MSLVKNNLIEIQKRMEQAALRAGRDPETVRLVAVSKRIALEHIHEAIKGGQHIFGENYLQDALEKIPLLDAHVSWHFIGHLQSNKAKQAARYFHTVETIDRLKIAQALDNHCGQFDRKLNVFIQVNTGREKQKAGVAPEEAEELAIKVGSLENLILSGLMTIPPYYHDPEEARPYFRALRILGEKMVEKGILGNAVPLELSMGMSNDFEVAIEEGATLVRVGTAIFGERM